MKLNPITLLALAGALCCTGAFAADATVSGKVLKTVSSETGNARQKPAETPRKEVGKAEAQGKLPQQQEVPVKVVLAAD